MGLSVFVCRKGVTVVIYLTGITIELVVMCINHLEQCPACAAIPMSTALVLGTRPVVGCTGSKAILARKTGEELDLFAPRSGVWNAL